MEYLKQNKSNSLGVDAPTIFKARKYWSLIQENYDYLAEYFEMSGLKKYIDGLEERGDYIVPYDFRLFYGELEIIKKSQGGAKSMYNFFRFGLNTFKLWTTNL